MKVSIDIGVGEALDRLSILQIKCTRLHSSPLKERVQREAENLEIALAFIEGRYSGFLATLVEINSVLWELEDRVRVIHNSSPDWKEAAMKIVMINDLRSKCKRCIDDHFESDVTEVKQYATK